MVFDADLVHEEYYTLVQPMSISQQLTQANQHDLIKRAPAKLERGAGAKIVFAGEFFQVWQWPQTLYDGSQTIFESLSRPDTVTVLALDQDKQIVITKQVQPGFSEFYSLPGGVMDDGEAVWQTAKRELLEETGYESQEWYFLFSHQMNSRIDWNSYYLLAKNCRQVSAKSLDAGEKIELELLDQKQFAELINNDKFRDIDFALWWLRDSAVTESLQEFMLK